MKQRSMIARVKFILFFSTGLFSLFRSQCYSNCSDAEVCFWVFSLDYSHKELSFPRSRNNEHFSTVSRVLFASVVVLSCKNVQSGNTKRIRSFKTVGVREKCPLIGMVIKSFFFSRKRPLKINFVSNKKSKTAEILNTALCFCSVSFLLSFFFLLLLKLQIKS